MSKLYEVLAVEPDLRKKADEAVKWVKSVFSSPTHLTGQVISFHPLLEDAQNVPDERVELATSVKALLSEFEKVFGSYLNVTLQKEAANTHTNAKVTIGETSFLDNLPATALLNLEQRLDDMRRVYDAIPTLDPTERWTFDEGQECYVSDIRSSFRTKKTYKTLTKAEATEHHPAQVEVYTEDAPTHERETIIFSGMITQREKSERLDRLAKLYRAVKQARQRANDLDADFADISKKIFDYINTGNVE